MTRHFPPRKRQRHQCLAIAAVPCRETRHIGRNDTNRTTALLRHRRVIDDQHRILAADQAIGLNQQFRPPSRQNRRSRPGLFFWRSRREQTKEAAN